MKMTLILYYSRSGSNRYLAERLAKELNADLERIRPRVGGFPLMMLQSLTRISTGVAGFKHDPAEYDRVILVGPVFMGQLIAPLAGALKKLKNIPGDLHFITNCGSSYEKKDETFGHGHVFKKAQDLLGEKKISCTALPIGLVVPEDKREDPDTVMKTRLGDENFVGEIKDRYDQLISSIQ